MQFVYDEKCDFRSRSFVEIKDENGTEWYRINNDGSLCLAMAQYMTEKHIDRMKTEVMRNLCNRFGLQIPTPTEEEKALLIFDAISRDGKLDPEFQNYWTLYHLRLYAKRDSVFPL